MKRKIRIELCGIRLYRLEAEGNTPGVSQPEESRPAFPDCGLELQMEGEDLPGFGTPMSVAVTDRHGRRHSGMTGWPGMEISFAVPADDIPRVSAWFTGDYHGVTLPESALLKKNMTGAVTGALENYIANATARNLFTSPFRAGWRYRLFDGSATPLRALELIHPMPGPPELPVHSRTLTEKSLFTTSEVRSIPSRLHFRLTSPDNLSEYSGIICALEIYATAQVPLRDPNGGVAGIRSHSIDGTPRRCWQYDHYTAEELKAACMADTKFRKIVSIPYPELTASAGIRQVPLSPGTLAGFGKLPLCPDDNREEDTGTDTEGWVPYRAVRTEALHLGNPEAEKRVKGVILRGVFRRDSVKLRLYGSHHREEWKFIAGCSGAEINGLCRVRYRWYRVEIEGEMRRDDFFEALTFTVTSSF